MLELSDYSLHCHAFHSSLRRSPTHIWQFRDASIRRRRKHIVDYSWKETVVWCGGRRCPEHITTCVLFLPKICKERSVVRTALFSCFVCFEIILFMMETLVASWVPIPTIFIGKDIYHVFLALFCKTSGLSSFPRSFKNGKDVAGSKIWIWWRVKSFRCQFSKSSPLLHAKMFDWNVPNKEQTDECGGWWGLEPTQGQKKPTSLICRGGEGGLQEEVCCGSTWIIGSAGPSPRFSGALFLSHLTSLWRPTFVFHSKDLPN